MGLALKKACNRKRVEIMKTIDINDSETHLYGNHVHVRHQIKYLGKVRCLKPLILSVAFLKIYFQRITLCSFPSGETNGSISSAIPF